MKKILTLTAMAFCASLAANAALAADKPNAQMSGILDELTKLPGKPIENCTPAEARKQPTLMDAWQKKLASEKKSQTIEVGSVKEIKMDTVPATVFTPAGKGPFPIIVYYHGGGFVIASNKVYEASARGLCKNADAVVFEVEYRKGPENKFPAAHDDAFTAYKWAVKNGAKYGGDVKKIAIVGESAGGNLTLSTAIQARDNKVQLPVYEVGIYPLVDGDTTKESYQQEADAKPLNAKMIPWFANNYFRTPADGKNPRFDLSKANLKGLPPTTIITAQIDPLRSDGKMISEKLKANGVTVKYKNYEGVTHEFFGADTALAEAQDAMKLVCSDLKNAFGK